MRNGESAAALRREIIEAAGAIGNVLSARCATCYTSRSRCPDCAAHQAKKLLEQIRRLRHLERHPTASLLPPASSLPTRRSRIRHIVSQLRRAGRPLPAARIAVPGVRHPKSILKLLSIATRLGLVSRARAKDIASRRTCYFYTATKPPKP